MLIRVERGAGNLSIFVAERRQRPDDAGILVGQCDARPIGTATFPKLVDPAAVSVVLATSSIQRSPGARSNRRLFKEYVSERRERSGVTRDDLQKPVFAGPRCPEKGTNTVP